jgi:hypothetical protein
MTSTRKYQPTQTELADLIPEDRELLVTVTATTERAKETEQVAREAALARRSAIAAAYDARIPRPLIAEAAGYQGVDAVQKANKRAKAAAAE